MGIKLVNLSAGSPYYNPHIQRPATYPPTDGYLPPEDPLLSVTRQLGLARACKARFPGLVFVGTGYSYLQEYLPHVAQHEVRSGHVDLIGNSGSAARTGRDAKSPIGNDHPVAAAARMSTIVTSDSVSE